MKIIVGHTNMDLDCLGSLVLARRLYPDHRAIQSRLMNPAARNLHNLYRDYIDLMPAADLKGQSVERMVIVDTRSFGRVKEYFEGLAPGEAQVEVFDHHPAEGSDIPGAVVRGGDTGANTTLLGLEVMRQGLELSPQEATIGLAGIISDTGNFSHENVRDVDFEVASHLMKKGAALAMVQNLVRPMQAQEQIGVFHDLLGRLESRCVNGHAVMLARLELERQTAGLAGVVEKIFEVEHPDILFAVFNFKHEGDTLIIGRSHNPDLDLPAILSIYGGAGHRQAASALVKKDGGRLTLEEFEERLRAGLPRAVVAGDIMSSPVATIEQERSLIEASIYLEQVNHTGAPVLNEAGGLIGMLTLRDIMRGRKVNQMKAPVKVFMSRKLVCAAPSTTLREIETLFFKHNIGHLPVVGEQGLAGIVTRADFLKAAAAVKENAALR